MHAAYLLPMFYTRGGLRSRLAYRPQRPERFVSGWLRQLLQSVCAPRDPWITSEMDR
jgi:hypothetical protein